jgi:hypothetical protein
MEIRYIACSNPCMQRAVPPIVRPASAQPVESPLAASNGVSSAKSHHRLAESTCMRIRR